MLHPNVLLQTVIHMQQVFVLVFKGIGFDSQGHAAIVNTHQQSSAATIQEGRDGFKPGDFDDTQSYLTLNIGFSFH